MFNTKRVLQVWGTKVFLIDPTPAEMLAAIQPGPPPVEHVLFVGKVRAPAT